MKFQVLRGVHYEDGQMFEAGSVVPSREPLDKLFPNKFKKVSDAEAESMAGGRTFSPVRPPVAELGDDVTDEFSAAKEIGLSVWHKGRDYVVTKEDGTRAYEHRITSTDQVREVLEAMIVDA